MGSDPERRVQDRTPLCAEHKTDTERSEGNRGLLIARTIRLRKRYPNPGPRAKIIFGDSTYFYKSLLSELLNKFR